MLIIISDIPGRKFGMGNDVIYHNAVDKAAHSLVLRVLVYLEHHIQNTIRHALYLLNYCFPDHVSNVNIDQH